MPLTLLSFYMANLLTGLGGTLASERASERAGRTRTGGRQRTHKETSSSGGSFGELLPQVTSFRRSSTAERTTAKFITSDIRLLAICWPFARHCCRATDLFYANARAESQPTFERANWFVATRAPTAADTFVRASTKQFSKSRLYL